MKLFESPNLDGSWVCPICKTAEDKPVTLVGKAGTEDGSIMEAIQVHVDCLELMIYYTDKGSVIAMQIPEGNNG